VVCALAVPSLALTARLCGWQVEPQLEVASSDADDGVQARG
jgi:hypothetical protein